MWYAGKLYEYSGKHLWNHYTSSIISSDVVHLRMTLFRKVINHVSRRVGDKNNSIDLLHPAFTKKKHKRSRKHIFPCGELMQIAKGFLN